MPFNHQFDAIEEWNRMFIKNYSKNILDIDIFAIPSRKG